MNVLERFKLTGRVAVVTGGAQGLGEAMARALGQAGARVVIADINLPKAQETAERMSQSWGIQARAIRVDVTKSEEAEALMDDVVRREGRLDILVNNAGIVRHIPAETMSEKDWDDVMDLNLKAVFLCSQKAAKHMIPRRSGNIINIASMSGFIVNVPQPQVSYNASKAGVVHLTRSLAVEWARYGIRVNAIAPGYMSTAMTEALLKTEEAQRNWIKPTPMQRPGEPDELGGAVVFLASDASSFITGHTLVVDGGYTLV